MKNAAKYVCLALCATLPLAYAGNVWSEVTPKKHIVKGKASKHKVRAKKPAKPLITARKPAPAKMVEQPTATTLASVSQALVPAIPVAPILAAIQPVAVVAAAPVQTNPYLPQYYVAAKAVNPYLPQPAMPWPEQRVSVPTINPYLASPAPGASSGTPSPARALVAPAPQAAPVIGASTNAYVASAASYAPSGAPVQNHAVQQPVAAPPAAVALPETGGSPKPAKPSFLASLDPKQGLSDLFSSVRNGIPLLNDQDLLPTIKKVYPTGEKPLVILSFKCPTEMLGVTPPPMKALHELINLGFDGINKTNLLSVNLQQVCN